MKPLIELFIKSASLYFDVDLSPVLTASEIFIYKLKTILK